MRVLVTGAAGAVGRHVVQHLRSRDREVSVLLEARDRSGHLWAEQQRLATLTGDVRDVASLRPAVSSVDAVVHLAGVAGIRPSDESRMYDVNVTGARRTAEACLEGGQRLVHVSAAAAVGLNADARPIEEDFDFAAAGVRHPYALSKRKGQDAVAAAVRRGLDGVILNPGAALLPGDPHAHAWSALPRILREGLRWAPPGGFGFVGRRTLLEAIDRALVAPRSPEPTLVVDQSTTYAAVFRMVAEAMGLRPPRVAPRHLTRLALTAAGRARSLGLRRLEVDGRLAPLALWPNVYGGARSRERLGITQRPLREAVNDLVPPL